MYWNLMKLRKEGKIRQSEMAALIGCSTSNYSRREQGKIQFKINEMKLIQERFNLPLEVIFLKDNSTLNANKGETK